MDNEKENGSSIYVVASSIVVAGLIIAGSIIYSNSNKGKTAEVPTGGAVAADTLGGANGGEIKLRSIDANEHIVGDINAPVKLVIYSDLECPFCKMFHETLRGEVQNNYVSKGKVVMVFRNFPLEQLHSKAKKEAEASECAASLGGNEKFWEFLDGVFAVTSSNNGLDPAELPKIAEKIGLKKGDFEKCLNGGEMAKVVEKDLRDGVGAGAQGTPYSVVIAANGKKSIIPGALPYEQIKPILDKALSEK